MPDAVRSPKCVLVVEDESSIAEVLGDVLTTEGYEVCYASDGEEGLRALARQPDLVLVDALMPRLNGHDMILAMKADPTRARIPVMLMSAASIQAPAQVPTLRKPFEVEHLLDAIERLIGPP